MIGATGRVEAKPDPDPDPDPDPGIVEFTPTPPLPSTVLDVLVFEFEFVFVFVLVLFETLSFSAAWAFSTSRATSDACAFFNVFFTNPVIKTLHLRSTSSLSHSPSFGTPRPSSATSRGSPGMFPPSVHLFLISTPIGAKT